MQWHRKANNQRRSKANWKFDDICEAILNCQGSIILIGIGKSGHIAKKISATLSSTGTRSYYINAAEACHGDIGLVTRNDIILYLSNSGESDEINTLAPIIKRIGVKLVSITSNSKSTLAEISDFTIITNVTKEACPLGLAPTTSSTAHLVLGDAIAVALLSKRKFTKEDFAFSHPGGKLGKRLTLKVSDLMHTDKEIPLVSSDKTIHEVLFEMSTKRFGIAGITNGINGSLCGVFTDGDLRRSINSKDDIYSTEVAKKCSGNYITVSASDLAVKALHCMEKNKITAIFITNDEKHAVGIIHIHDLLNSGII